MKKVILVLVFLSSCFITFAQVQVGFSAGYTNTTIKGTMVDHYESRTDDGITRRNGFNFSLALRWRLNDLLHLETGAGFFQKGGSVYKSGFVDDLIMTGNYIDIPLVIGIRTPGRSFHLVGEAGASYGIMLNCQGRGCYNVDRTFTFPAPLTNLDEPGKTFDIKNPIAIVYGGGFELEPGEDVTFIARARFYNDVNYFFGNKKDFSVSGSGMAIELGVRFRVD